jgi:hypothetical protein
MVLVPTTVVKSQIRGTGEKGCRLEERDYSTQAEVKLKA